VLIKLRNNSFIKKSISFHEGEKVIQ